MLRRMLDRKMLPKLPLAAGPIKDVQPHRIPPNGWLLAAAGKKISKILAFAGPLFWLDFD